MGRRVDWRLDDVGWRHTLSLYIIEMIFCISFVFCFLPHPYMDFRNWLTDRVNGASGTDGSDGLRRTRLLEILGVVIGLAVIAGVIFVGFVRPRQGVEAVRVQNDTNVVAIRRALDQARNDAGGDLSAVVTLPGVLTPIGSGNGEINLCGVLVPSYLATMPYKVGASGVGVGGVDAVAHYTSCADYETGYRVMRDAVSGVVSVE